MGIHDVMMGLAKKGISTSMHYDENKKLCYIDLNTKAKSHLHLFEDGMLYGRYDHEKKIDLTKNIEDIVTELCHEFNDALHGRNYCQQAWADLCVSKGIVLDMLGM